MSIKQVVLHIGWPKTGTTSCQQTLYREQNRGLIEGKGYKYINAWKYDTIFWAYSLFRDNPHYYLTTFYGPALSEEEGRKINEGFKNQLLSESLNTSLDILLLSSECFCLLSVEEVHRVKDFFVHHFGNIEFKIIGYVRNPVAQTVSAVQEDFSRPAGYILDMREPWLPLIERLRKNYMRKSFAPWLQVFGRNSVELYQFEEAIKYPTESLVGHFFSVLGFSDEEILKLKIEKGNESRAAEVIELLEHMHHDFPPYVQLENGRWQTNPLKMSLSKDTNALLDVPGIKYDFSYDQKKVILDAVAEDAIWLKETIGIDYTKLELNDSYTGPVYSDETIEAFIQAFERISHNAKPYFVQFFKEKFQNTGDEKFKKLFDKGSRVYAKHQIALSFAKYMKQALPETKFKENMRCARWPETLVLYYSSNRNFLQQNRTWFIIDNSHSLSGSIEFRPEDNIRNIKFLHEMFPLIVLIKKIKVNGREVDPPVTDGNFTVRHQDLFVFYQVYPQVAFEFDEIITSFEFEIYIDTCSQFFSFCIEQMQSGYNLDKIDDDLRQIIASQQLIQETLTLTLAERSKFKQNLKQMSDILTRRKTKLKRSLEKRKTKLYKMLGIKSWKKINPLIKIRDYVKGKPKP